MADTVIWQINPPTKAAGHARQLPAKGLLFAYCKNSALVINGLQNSTRPLQVAVYTPQGKRVLFRQCIQPVQSSCATVSLSGVKLSGGMYIVSLFDTALSSRRTIQMLVTE
jgi:hypothetical protein